MSYFRPTLRREGRVKQRKNDGVPLSLILVKLKQDIRRETCSVKKSRMEIRYNDLLELFKEDENEMSVLN